MRTVLAIVGLGLVTLFGACSTKDEAPPPTAPSVLSVTTFDVSEAGWGDAPLPVHFTWTIQSSSGRPLTCKLDYDGDGKFDREITDCKADSTTDAPAVLPTFTYAVVGEHVPRLVVTDGEQTVEATQSIYANKLDYAKTVVFPEKLPGFVKAEATPNTKVVLTFDDASHVPDLSAGSILWGTSGNGYLIKATTASKAGTTVTVDGVQGKIEEAVENGFLGARDVVAPFNDPRCIEGAVDCSGVEFEKLDPGLPVPSSAPGTTTKSIGKSSAPLEIKAKGSFGLKVKLPTPDKSKFDHSLFVGFNVKKFVLQTSFFSVKRFEIDLLPTFSYEFGIKWASPKRSFPMPIISLGTIPIGPIVIAPVLTPSLEFQAALKVTATAGVSLPFHVKYDPDKGFTNGFTPDLFGGLADFLAPNGASASATAEVKCGLKLAALIFGIGGPSVGPIVTGTLEGKVTTPSSDDLLKCPSWPLQLCLNYKVGVGGEVGLSFPWIKELEVNQPFTLASLTLYENCLGKPDKNGNCPPRPDAGPLEEAGADTSVADTSVADTSVADASTADSGAEEICDGIDNNGDFRIDEGCPGTIAWLASSVASPIWGYTGTTAVYGGSAFGVAPPYCIAVGICGRYDANNLTNVGAYCGNTKLVRDTTVVPHNFTVEVTPTTLCYSGGTSSGGTVFDFKCPAGMMVQRVIGTHGTTINDRIGQIQVECVKWGLSRAAGNVWRIVREGTSMSPVYGSGAGTAFDWIAPDIDAARPGIILGIDGRYANAATPPGIYQLRAITRNYNLTFK